MVVQKGFHMKLSRVILPVALALAASAAFTTQSLSAQTTAAGAYTAAQAKSGAAIYTAQCSMCHGVKLEGVSGPPLAGSTFVAKWSGQTADDLRDIIATQMPLTAPGSLKPAEVLAVLSYILQQNKYPAGPSALTAPKSKTVKIVKQG
jgi:mono/diheme cytochrome c family protein